VSELYPPSVSAPQIVLAASSAHRRGVVRLVVGLLGFAATYLALLVGCVAAPVALVRAALVEPVLWVVAAPTTLLFAMLVLVLVRGLVRRAGARSASIEVTRAEQPQLFAFLDRLTAEAGAPMPDRVVLSAGVNAAMLRRSSVIGLVFGGRRELVLGLGLVNVLDLRELKAVIAHELGHFAQSSARVGQWAHRAIVVLTEIVLGRDRFDERLAANRGARSVAVRMFATLLTVGVRGLRRVLARMLVRITRSSQALAREMEFNADLHAVALCGSDPIVAALWRAQRGALAMNASLSLLVELGNQGVFSDDLYGHQAARWAELDERPSVATEDPMLAAVRAPYRYGPSVHFPAGEAPAEVMWYSHPSYREREVNAKRCYVEAPEQRWPSAWILFDDPAALRRRATQVVYAELGFASEGSARSRAVDEVEQRIAAELAEREQGAQYFGFYANRIVELGDLDELIRAAQTGDDATWAERARAWRGPGLERFMQRWRATELRLDALRPALSGPAAPTAAIELLAEAEGERERQRGEARAGDRAVFCWLWRLAEGDARVEFEARHRFSSFVQAQIVALNGHHATLMPMFAALGAREYEHDDAPAQLLAGLDALHRELEALLEAAAAIRSPALHNLDAGLTREFLLGEPIVPAYEPGEALRPWLARFMAQVTCVHDRLRMLHYKNLGRLLALGEAIERAAQRGRRGNSSRTSAEAADVGESSAADG